ncbi:MAG: hypothetical protein ACI87E_002448, partial [Mariniblastus sp.]
DATLSNHWHVIDMRLTLSAICVVAASYRI